MKYVCSICAYEYDEDAEGVEFSKLPDSWVCPVCGVGKGLFSAAEPEPAPSAAPAAKGGAEPAGGSCETACDVIAETLAGCGVKWVFGMVGHSNLGMADSVRRLAGAGRLGFVGIRHEGAAAFACSAYGKLTGRPAACLTIAGPGATNLMTGLYDAKLDGAPAIALTGQIPSTAAGFYEFQEIDLARAFSDVACSQHTLSASSAFGRLAADAYENAVLRRGVSQIILPDDAQTLPACGAAAASPRRAFHMRAAPDSELLEKAANAIASSSRPVIIAGEGARACPELVAELAGILRCPVLTTYRAKGLLPDSHPRACGVVGRSGTPVAARFLSGSDCIVACGVGFSNHSAIPKDIPAVQIDCDAAAIGRMRPVAAGVLGDCAPAIEGLCALLEGSSGRFSETSGEIAGEWAAWRSEKAARAAKGREGALAPALVARAMSDAVEEDAIISVDVGNVAYWFGRYFEASRQRFLLSWYLGSIGVGLPAAMGAWCAAREEGPLMGRPVWAVVGDGGIGQYLAEWTTAVRCGMDIKCVVSNNSELAKISREQEIAKMSVWETGLLNPSFAEFSRSCGALGIRVEKASDLAPALAEAAAHRGPVLVEVMTDPNLA